jgi:hypothetical protein
MGEAVEVRRPIERRLHEWLLGIDQALGVSDAHQFRRRRRGGERGMQCTADHDAIKGPVGKGQVRGIAPSIDPGKAWNDADAAHRGAVGREQGAQSRRIAGAYQQDAGARAAGARQARREGTQAGIGTGGVQGVGHEGGRALGARSPWRIACSELPGGALEVGATEDPLGAAQEDRDTADHGEGPVTARVLAAEGVRGGRERAGTDRASQRCGIAQRHGTPCRGCAMHPSADVTACRLPRVSGEPSRRSLSRYGRG